MAKKKRLPKDFETLLAKNNLPALQAVFNECDVNARGGYAKQTALALDACRDELARWLIARGADLSVADTWAPAGPQSGNNYRVDVSSLI